MRFGRYEEILMRIRLKAKGMNRVYPNISAGCSHTRTCTHSHTIILQPPYTAVECCVQRRTVKLRP